MIAAVVVTYSAPAEVLDQCLASLQAAGGLDAIVVVDTGGRADVADRGVHVLRVENNGYGAAANAGIRLAVDEGATAIALLNDDVVVADDWLDPLLDEFDGADRVGAVQPKLLMADSDPSRINSVGVQIDAMGAGLDVGDGHVDVPGPWPVMELSIFTGGAVVFSRAFLESVGGFDERYFLYYEDVDLALRGRALGWTYLLVPDSIVWHERGVSTGDDPARTLFLQERNRLWAAFRFEDAGTIGRSVWLSVRRLRHAPRPVHARALLAGVAGAPGALWRRARRVNRI